MVISSSPAPNNARAAAQMPSHPTLMLPIYFRASEVATREQFTAVSCVRGSLSGKTVATMVTNVRSPPTLPHVVTAHLRLSCPYSANT
jgi:hypothetical protein